MRATDRDRRGPAITALCAALVIATVVAPCAALYAEYRVLPNGTAYSASVEVTANERFEFYEPGLLGERVPIKVSGISINGNCSPCHFNMSGGSAITFEKGDYTINYTAPLRDFHLQLVFDKPYRINITLPERFDLRNPLLGSISSGGTWYRGHDNSTTIWWNRTTAADLRFYDSERESLLYLFGNFWVVIAIVLLMPFLLTMRKKE